MKAQHTPGPWEKNSFSGPDISFDLPKGGKAKLPVSEVYTPAGQSIALVHCPEEEGGDIYAKQHANARLIASAPDLMAALFLALEQLVSFVDAELVEDDDPGPMEAITAARAAIAKAYGEEVAA